ncbi:MAG: hypothetical protein KAU50_11400 [Candidatus Marinimicrobia bacterium]|nr:hypothetical protein [Candidatus Neomarinimicrobiota bacterium]
MTGIEIASVIIAGTSVIGVMITTHRYNSTSHARIYERIEGSELEITDKIEKDYTRKDIFTLTHQQVNKELAEIKKQTTLIPGIAAQLEILVGGEKE